MAAVLTFFCPGLGHLVLGRPFAALLIFVLTTIGYLMFVVPGLIIHVYAIVRAHNLSREQHVEDIRRAMHG